MVLDYDEQPPSDSGYDSNKYPISDLDPYLSPEARKWFHKEFASFPTKISLPPFNLPRRLIHWSELYYEATLAKSIVARLETARAMANRNPTQEETDALVQQSALLLDVPEAMGYVGAGFGVYMWRKQEKFEWRAAEAETGKLPPAMQGRMLRWARMRGVILFPFYFVAGYWVANVMSRLGMSVVLSRDSRLERFKQDVTSQNPEEINKRLAHLRDRVTARNRALMEERRRQIQGGVTGKPTKTDDASPTGSRSESGDSFGQYDSYDQQPGDSKILNEVYSRPSNAFDQQQQSQSQPQSQGRSFWDDGDDASPTNPSVDTTPLTTSSSGSAWERIRQSAVQGSSNPRSQSSSSDDSWQSSDYASNQDSGDRYSRGSR